MSNGESAAGLNLVQKTYALDDAVDVGVVGTGATGVAGFTTEAGGTGVLGFNGGAPGNGVSGGSAQG